jgi:hypothetical protein
MLVAHKTVSFLWFESQKIMGRREPWSPKQPIIQKTSQTSQEEMDPNEPKTKPEDSGLSTPYLQHRIFQASNSDHHTHNSIWNGDINSDKQPGDNENSDKQLGDNENSDKQPGDNENCDKQPGDNENSTLLQDHAVMQTPNTNSQEITVAQLSDIATLPQDPAPRRPDSTNIELPKRKIRTELNAMEEDDAIGKSVAFLWWFFFLFARILSMAACANLQPYAMFTVLIHYIIMMAHLLHQAGFPSIYKVFIQLCLGYVFTFCFIEFRYKIKNVIVFYSCYFSLMLTETLVMSLSWYFSSDDMEGFWYQYMFTVIFGSYAISCLCMASYLTILKPEVKVIYI